MSAFDLPPVDAQVVPAALDSSPPLAPYRRPVERLRAAKDSVLRVLADMQRALESDDSGAWPASS